MQPAFLLATLTALSCFALRTTDEAVELWQRGERLAAIEKLADALDSAPPAEADALRARLVAWELAVHRYASALEHAGDAPALASQRGVALYRLARYDEALPLLPAADAFLALLRLDALEALDRLDEHDRELATALEVFGPSAYLLALDGRRLARAGEHAAAAERFRAALELDPYHATAMFGLGQALVRNGEREQALAVLAEHRRIAPLLDQLDFARRGVDLAPLHGSNHARVADVERQLGRLDRAEAAYELAVELSEDQELVPIALRWARLAAEDRGDPDAALAILDAALARATDLRLLVRRGDVLFEAQRPQAAARAYERALEVRPDDRQLQERLAAARAAASTGTESEAEGER